MFKCRRDHWFPCEKARVKKAVSLRLQWQPLSYPGPLQLRASPWLCKAATGCSGHLEATPGGKEDFLFSREKEQGKKYECQSFLSCLFFLSSQRHPMALILFLQDVAAGCDFMHRYCTVMTWLIWQRVDLDQERLCVTALCKSVQTIEYVWCERYICYRSQCYLMLFSSRTLPLKWHRMWGCKIFKL